MKGGGDKLLRNDDGKFVDVSEEAGIYGSLIGFGLGVTVGDVNEDGYPIFMCPMIFTKGIIYILTTKMELLKKRLKIGQHISHSSMGADMADINNDGFLDIFVTDMLPEKNKRLKDYTIRKF